ncbi:MAG: GNAT family N-acetyltransferase [Actinomycetia bacterium]|nr:GNAT family N-acetyltransferase [Actinomycetes bacterium]MCP4959836.1 GNAT family N-acetyltransferase [Actinomycetes bacterium]
MGVTIRAVRDSDRGAVVAIARQLVDSADTYTFDADIDDEALWQYFSPIVEGRGYVAELTGQVCGTFAIRPNQPGPGSHVANASFAVGSTARGHGVGRTMGEAALNIAAELGYRAMQFNIVVSTNEAAVRLWSSLGFEIVGTVPEGFRRPTGEYVDYYLMNRSLAEFAG